MRLFFCVLAFLGLFKGPAPIDTVKLLAIGGDFHDDAVVLHLGRIASSDGKTLEIGFCDSTADPRLNSGGWDTFLVSQSDPDVAATVSAIRQAMGKKARILLWQTDIESSRKLSKKLSVSLVSAKCATSELEAYTGNDGAAYEDGHLTAQGAYTLACSLYEALFKTKVFGNRYSGNLDDEDRRSAQLAADAAVKKPFKICLK